MPDQGFTIRPEVLLSAYGQGVFPMADLDADEVHWYQPSHRGIIPLDEFRLPRSDRKILTRNVFEVVADRDFESVICQCANEKRQHGWINETIIQSYGKLHELGFAHSVEAWKDGQLVGGLYGIALHGAFFGESMFSRPDLGGSNASKICLARLVEHLVRQGYQLLDTQFHSEHLARFGCIEISEANYMTRLETALSLLDVSWGRFI